jgi:hypothetical protein
VTNIRLLFLHLLVESNSDVFYYVVAHSFKTFAVRMQTRCTLAHLPPLYQSISVLCCPMIFQFRAFWAYHLPTSNQARDHSLCTCFLTSRHPLTTVLYMCVSQPG